MTDHSWKWLTPRITQRNITEPSVKAKTRPAMPSMEALDDRVMLSATTAGTSTNLNAILIGLIKASTPVLESELTLFQKAVLEDKRKDKWMPVMKADLVNIDSLLMKYGEQLIKGKLGTAAATTLQNKMDVIFAKMNTLLMKFAPNSADLSPAVQKVREAALGVISSLSQFNNSGVAAKTSIDFVKIAKDFLNIDKTVLALGENLLLNGKVDLDKQLSAKVSDIFQKTQTLVNVKLGGDPALLAAVQDAQTQITGFLNGLSGGGTTFKGGPTVVSNGDVIG